MSLDGTGRGVEEEVRWWLARKVGGEAEVVEAGCELLVLSCGFEPEGVLRDHIERESERVSKSDSS